MDDQNQPNPAPQSPVAAGSAVPNPPTQSDYSFPQGASSDFTTPSPPPQPPVANPAPPPAEPQTPAPVTTPVEPTLPQTPASPPPPSNMPPVPLDTIATPPSPASPPPMPPAPPAPMSSPKKGGFIKKLILVFLLLLALVGLVAATIFIILPKLKLNTPFTKEVTLTWWGLWEDKSAVQPLIDDYQSSHPQVKIEYIAQSKEDYRERLVNSLAQKKGPDIMRFHNSWTPMLKGNLATIPSNIMSDQEFTSTFYSVAATDLKTSSGYVGIPLEYDGLGLYINEEIFSTFGVNPPSTWDELRDLAVKLTLKNADGVIQQAGVALGRTENVDHWPEILALMMLQNRADPANPTTDLAAGAVTYYSSISETYGIWDENLPDSTTYFASGKLGMMFAPSWRVFEILEQNPTLKFKVVSVPQLPKDNDPTLPDMTYASYWAEGVSQSSENQSAAWEFLKYLSQKENLEKLYANASKLRRFGEPYPRQDMRDSLLSEPLVSGFMLQAPNARSWYLASRTWDGPTGINSKIIKYYEDAINAVNKGEEASTALKTTATGVQQELVNYGLSAPPAPTAQ